MMTIRGEGFLTHRSSTNIPPSSTSTCAASRPRARAEETTLLGESLPLPPLLLLLVVSSELGSTKNMENVVVVLVSRVDSEGNVKLLLFLLQQVGLLELK